MVFVVWRVDTAGVEFSRGSASSCVFGTKNKSLPQAWLFIPTNTKVLLKDGKVLIREAALVAPSGKSGRDPGHSYKQVIRSLKFYFLDVQDLYRSSHSKVLFIERLQKKGYALFHHLSISGMMIAIPEKLKALFFFFFKDSDLIVIFAQRRTRSADRVYSRV